MKSAKDSRRTLAKKSARPAAKAVTLSTSASVPRPAGKLGVIVDRIAARNGAIADELVTATGWQRHSVLGALSRLKTRGFAIRLDAEADRKAYRLQAARA